MATGNRFSALCLVGLVVVGGGSACTSTRRGVQRLASSHLADTATSYNLAIEQTQDEMLLLNVIRAQDNYPLYLTDASKVTGTVKADISLGLKIPLLHAGSANANDYFAMPSVDYSSSPSMDVNLLNTKEFMTGFLAPIQTDLFAYYWDQGWPSELLLYLLVLRVDEYKEEYKEGKYLLRFSKTFYNQPDMPDSSQNDLQEFSQWVHTLVGTGRPQLCSEDADDVAVGPPLDAEHLGALKYLVPVAKEGLSLNGPSAATEGKWQLGRPKTLFSLAPHNAENRCPTKLKQSEIVQASSSSNQQEARQLVRPFAPAHLMARGADGVVDVLTLRSPEGMLYYLGQLARLENRAKETRALLIHVCDYFSGCAPHDGDEPPVAPLFVALDKQAHGPCPSIIWVRSLDGHDYMIPSGKDVPPKLSGLGDLSLADASRLCATGQTMHAFALLTQLIGMQKSVKDFTTTSTVKVVGQ